MSRGAADTPRACLPCVVAQRRWTLRGGDPEQGTILVVTQHEHRLDEIALDLSSHGFYTFVAVPDAVASLWAVTRFDLVILMSDVGPASRTQIAQISPPIEPRLLTLDAVEEASIVDRILARFSS